MSKLQIKRQENTRKYSLINPKNLPFLIKGMVVSVMIVIGIYILFNNIPIEVISGYDKPETKIESSEEQKLEDSPRVISNGTFGITLTNPGTCINSKEAENLFRYTENVIDNANIRLQEIGREQLNLDKYDFTYDGVTLTIKSNQQYDKYVFQHSINAEKQYIVEYLARIIDLEAGYGSVSDFNEKTLVAKVFLIRVDEQYQSFDGVFFDTNQYGSSSRFDWKVEPSAEALQAAEAVYEEYQSGSLDVPDWLWCQGMEIWGDIYQISFQYPEIEGQSPQYFTEG